MSVIVRFCAHCAAAGALVAARAWLSVAPGRALRSLINPDDQVTGRGSRRSVTGRGSQTCEALRRAVVAVGVRRPFSATCLEQGVALVVLLRIARIPAQLVVGVRRAEPTICAHAWVECAGAVVLGGAHAQGLLPLVRSPLAPPSSSPPSSVSSSCPG